MRKELKTTTVYFADDGKMFERKEDCERYERRLAAFKGLQNIETFPLAEGMFPPDGIEHTEDYEYTWYRPKTREQLDVLVRFYGIKEQPDMDAVGKIVCIEHGNGDSWLYTLDDCIEYMQNLKKRLGMH